MTPSHIGGAAYGGTPGEPDAESIAAQLRDALARWASGVTIVAARESAGRVAATTVTAFCPVSLEPPLVLVCLHSDAVVTPAVLHSGRFTVSILGQSRRRLASAFADRFGTAPAAFTATPDPFVDDALAALICAVEQTHPGGDHHIVVGRVEQVRPGRLSDPLIRYRRDYRVLG
ncbi:MAG: flavin reductase family protein [Longimicrobiales bacterium]